MDKIVLAGMSGNLCVESHLRELLEDGFEVAVVVDATASAVAPGYYDNVAAEINYRFVASHVYTTKEFEQSLKK
ncbi:isochorismatase family protein [Flagellimonas sp. GZD32]|uniref:isochorismatase family protein n=1 Tax=Flagellimonas cixiensis TaxID=3228750 RepID=UPI0035C8EDC5